MTYLIAYIIAAIICSTLSFGMTLGYFQNKYPAVRTPTRDTLVAAGFAAFSLLLFPTLLIFFLSGFNYYGMKFRAEPPTGEYFHDIYGDSNCK